MKKNLVIITFIGFSFLQPFQFTEAVSFSAIKEVFGTKPLAVETMDLTDRYPDPWVNEVFTDNMLLALHYLKGDICHPEKAHTSLRGTSGTSDEVISNSRSRLLRFARNDESEKNECNNLDWNTIRKPFEVKFILEPGEVFAFHEEVLPEFKGKAVKTIGAKFNSQEGFRSDGWLVGDGVCHLATLINWVATEASLKVVSHANHDFRPVPGIARQYGTSIFWGNQHQNLYIENTLQYPIKFEFKVDSSLINLSILRL